MKTIKKQEIRKTTETVLNELLTKHEIGSPSKRTQRILAKASERISAQLKREIKKRHKKNLKAYKKTNQKSATAA